MSSRNVLLLAGAGLGFAAAALWFGKRQPRGASSRAVPREKPSEVPVYLNSASPQDFRKLGLEAETVDRIIENRPYRNKLDLISRLIVPEDVYTDIHNRIAVERPDEPVKIA